jgi:hypothetical protein
MNVSLESKALSLLETYEGGNNYLIELKRKSQLNRKFYPTRSQSEYIINNHDKQPKVAKKWVILDTYFAQKLADDKLYTEIPQKVWVEKLLSDKEKAYHIWGKVFENEELHHFWLPKAAIIKDNTVKNVVIDYSKYSNRPPLDHQIEAVQKLVENKKFILADDMGLGKSQSVSSIIYTPNGVKKMGELSIGDNVIGSNGEKCKVTGVFPQGIINTYKITFNDGFHTLCCGEHLWSVSSPNYGKNRKNSRIKKSLVLSTKQMFEGGKITIKGAGVNLSKDYDIDTYYKSSNGNNKWQIPIVKPIRFENNNVLPIDPYFLGLSLGDGHFNKVSIKIGVHKDDYDELLNKFNLTEHKPTKNIRVGYINLKKEINELKLGESRSYNKFIPETYKYSSIENRLSILQGLMDTDGHCMIGKNNNFYGTEYSTISEKLCDDVAEIVHTLGGICRKKSRRSYYKKDGIRVECNLSYRLNIKLPPGMNPFRLKRKSERYVDPKKYPTGRYIKNIEKFGEDECVCISVDSPDKLYVAEHGIVTHNTTATIIASLETKSKKILIICPATLKINWKREIENYSDRPIYIAEGKNFSTEHDFVIANYDIMKNFHDPKKKDDSLILMSKFDLIIIDEAHMIKNPQALRTKLINDITKSVDRLWLLTGTPMTSRPMDYFNLLSLIDSPVSKNWLAYAVRYCAGFQFKVGPRKIWNVQGASNLEELRDRTAGLTLRRLKENVLDLPDKIITPVYLRLKSKLYEEVMGDYYNWYEKNPEESKSLTVQFTKLTKIRQIIADEKISQTIEIAENIIEQDKKVIIFCNFTDSLNKITEHFGKSAVKLDGSMSKVGRQFSVDQFQENDKIKVFVGNIKAAGVGITLTSAEAVIFNDLSFLPSDHAQAEDRAYRYGQKNNVLVYYPIFENTIEGIIYDILHNKKQVIATVMGDNQNTADAAEEIMTKINSLRKK